MLPIAFFLLIAVFTIQGSVAKEATEDRVESLQSGLLERVIDEKSSDKDKKKAKSPVLSMADTKAAPNAALSPEHLRAKVHNNGLFSSLAYVVMHGVLSAISACGAVIMVPVNMVRVSLYWLSGILSKK